MTDWFERRRIALDAWELGKALMTPKPRGPIIPPLTALRGPRR